MRKYIYTLLCMLCFVLNATAQTYDIEFTTTNVEPEHDPNNNNYVFFLYSEDGKWKVQLNYFSESMYGTFTTEDFHLNRPGSFNYIRDPKSDWEFYSFKELNMTVSDLPTETHIEAFCKTSNNKSVHVVGSIAKIDIDDIEEVNLGRATTTWNDFFQVTYIKAQNETYDLTFGITGKFREGTFYVADLIRPEFIKLPNDTIWARDAVMDVTAVDGEGNYDILLKLIAQDEAKQYNIAMTYSAQSMEATDTLNLTLSHNTKINDLSGSFGLYQFYGEDSEYQVGLAVQAAVIDESKLVFGVDDVSLSYSGILCPSDNKQIRILDASGAIIPGEEANTVMADLLGDDNILYRCKFIFPKGEGSERPQPGPNDIIVDFGNKVVVMDYTESNLATGDYNLRMMAAAGDYNLSLAVRDHQFLGSYGTEDIDLDGSYIVYIDHERQTNVISDITAGNVYAEKVAGETHISMNLSTRSNTYFMTVVLADKPSLNDSVEYQIDLNASDASQFLAVIDGYEGLPSGTLLQLASGLNDEGDLAADKAFVFNLYPYKKDGAGKFSVEGTYGFSDGTMSDAFAQYVTDGGTEVRFLPVAGTLTITRGEAVTIDLFGEDYTTYQYDFSLRMLGNNGVIYNGTGSNHLIFLDEDYNFLSPVGSGTQTDPYIIEAGVPAKGPKASTDYPVNYTYYKYTATSAGIVSLNVSNLGNIVGDMTLGFVSVNCKSDLEVEEGDVVTIRLAAETDATGKTFTLNLRSYAEGETKETAKVLKAGNNQISAVAYGALAQWYKVNVPANKKVTVKFTDYPTGTVEGIEGATFTYESTLNCTAVIANNLTDEAADLYIRLTFANQQTANVTFSDAEEQKTPIEKVGMVAFTAMAGEMATPMTDGCGLDEVPDSIVVTFPNIIGGEADDDVMVAAYVFETQGGQQTGAPINLDNYSYTGTVSEGVAIKGVTLQRTKSYLIQISTIGIRVKGDNGHGGYIYEYSYPNADEHDPQTLNFFIKKTSAIDGVAADTATSTNVYSISGIRLDAPDKGINIIEGKKKLVK